MLGHFITFEGGEGAGKSTQILRLKEKLEQAHVEVLVTREPGGSPGAERIREALLSGAAKALGPKGEAILFAAARADHVDNTIRPALERGAWVLCDRYADSTRVYQGEAGVPVKDLELLEIVAVGGIRPDLTILIDVPPEIGLSRVAKRTADTNAGGPDRFEIDEVGVHERRRQLFLKLAASEPWRFAVIDGSGDTDQVEQDIWTAVCDHFPKLEHKAKTNVVSLVAEPGGDGA